jgi:hypothetical protein
MGRAARQPRHGDLVDQDTHNHNKVTHFNLFMGFSTNISALFRMRLQEGFSFAHSTSGIINMLLEVTMQAGYDTHPCVVQYVLFPPHQATTKEK